MGEVDVGDGRSDQELERSLPDALNNAAAQEHAVVLGLTRNHASDKDEHGRDDVHGPLAKLDAARRAEYGRHGERRDERRAERARDVLERDVEDDGQVILGRRHDRAEHSTEDGADGEDEEGQVPLERRPVERVVRVVGRLRNEHNVGVLALAVLERG